jgi:hypothetical protein
VDIDRNLEVRLGVAAVSAPLKVLAGQSAVVLNGLKATVGGFVSVTGDFGVQKVAGGSPDRDALVIVANNAEARVQAGVALRAGVRNAKLAMLVRGDQKLALQATGVADLNLGDGFVSVSASSIGVAFNNTGFDLVDTTVSVSVGTATVSAPLNVLNGQASVMIRGLQATIGGFVTLSGDFGVKRSTVELVANYAGVSHMTIYRRWPSKR